MYARSNWRNTLAVTITGLVLLTPIALSAGRESFDAPQEGQNLGVWRITNDPGVRHWANYHNTQCWSPDGRYLCFTEYGRRLERGRYREHNVVYVYDLYEDKTMAIDRGSSPRWANQHNWLFYVNEDASRGPSYADGARVYWIDIEQQNRKVLVCSGFERLGETDFADRWIYAAARHRGESPEFRIHRIPIMENAQPEALPDVQGAQLLPSSRHPVFFTRQDHNAEPFGATRWWHELDGGNRQIFAPTIQKCHMSWLGNGEYLLFGNGLIRGRRWNEPFPSNIHILSSVVVGDVSPCGRSGRYVCGDSRVSDLRSGDGWFFLHPLSIICYPRSVADNSGIYDADPKGSPDGTKVCFVSNYDLKDGPLTHIRSDVRYDAESIPVDSTNRFPESGAVVVQREVINYTHKTPTSFEGITRTVYDTQRVNLRQGRAVTSFQARCLSDAEWSKIPGPSHAMQKSILDADSPLLRQRQTDVYVVVVRQPDAPWLRQHEQAVELIPGEEHYETKGYHLYRDGKQVTRDPVQPGEAIDLPAGEYRATAIEYCGLQSPQSNQIAVSEDARLRVLTDAPEDFSWFRREFFIDGSQVADVSLLEGRSFEKRVIHRASKRTLRTERFEGGELVARLDFGGHKHATRRRYYEDGRLKVREYFGPENAVCSREVFDEAGDVVTWTTFAPDGRETNHWRYTAGMPVLQRRKGVEYIKRGERFGFMREGRFVDTPRGSLSN